MRKIGNLLGIWVCAVMFLLLPGRAAHADYYAVIIVQIDSSEGANDPEMGINVLAATRFDQHPGDCADALHPFFPSMDGVWVQHVYENDDGTETEGETTFEPVSTGIEP